jgi:ATP-dependent DNA helicase RecG
VLLLGVADRPPRPVVGTRAFPDTVDAAEKLFQSMGFRVDIEAVAHPDGRVLVFHVPSRPRGTAYHHDGKYLMRAGEALVPMSEDQLRRIFAEGQPDWLEEPSRSGLDAQEVVELLDAQTFFELLKLPYPTERAGVLDRLVRERLVDEAGGGYTIRRLGALLLARRLTGFPDVSRKAPRGRLPVAQRPAGGPDAPHGNLRGEEQRHRPRGASGRGVPASGPRLPFWLPAHVRDDLRSALI